MEEGPLPPRANSSKAKILNDKYVVGDEIGKGAYGKVYKGLDLQSGQTVAIKQVSLENIPNEDLSSIMMEIDLLKMLKHKNIVEYLGSFKTKQYLYIILEYVENGALSNHIKANKFGPFPESLVALYIAQVLSGLEYLHGQGVIHRDIKGANILTTKEGLVKLADFGVATKLSESDMKTASVVGTPYWMAPEVIEMSGVSTASDIWSVGCTIIELLTGAPPYFDLQPMPALFRIVQDNHPPLPESISAATEDFLHQCFRKDSKQRSTAKQLLRHPWIRNTRKNFQQSWKGGRFPGDPELAPVVEVSIGLEPPETIPPSIPPSASRSSSLRSTRDSIRSGKGGRPRTNISDIAFVSKPPTGADAGKGVLGQAALQPATSADSTSTIEEVATTEEKLQSLGLGPPPLPSKRTDPGKYARPPTTTTPAQTLHDEAAPSAPTPGPASAPSPSAHQTPRLERISSRASYGGGDGDEHLGIESKLKKIRGPRLLKAEDMPLYEASAQMVGGASSQLEVFRETDADADFEDLFEDYFVHQSYHTVSLAGWLRERMSVRKELALKHAEESYGQDTDDYDLFMEGASDGEGAEEEFSLPADGVKDVYTKQAAEIARLTAMLRPDQREASIVSACQQLISIFKANPAQKVHLVTHHGVIPIMEMLDVSNASVLVAVLALANQIIEGNAEFQENLCLVGLIPTVMRFAGPDWSPAVRMQAAAFMWQMCHTSTLTLQMFVACRGLPVLVVFFEPNYEEYTEMVHMAIDDVWKVFEMQSPTPKNDFCRLFAKAGLLERLVYTVEAMNATRIMLQARETGGAEAAPSAAPNDDRATTASTASVSSAGKSTSAAAVGPLAAPTSTGPSLASTRQHLEKVANLLLVFSHADTVVKTHMCSLDMLHRLLKLLHSLEPPIMVKVLKCIKQLSMDPNTLDFLQRANAIPTLVPFLQKRDGPYVTEMHNQVLNAMYNLCKINKVRQEQAAMAGIIPQLMHFINKNSPSKQFALPLLCDMVHASRRTRAELDRHGVLAFYLELLDQEYWQVTALDSISVWLQQDTRLVEPYLLQPTAIQKLVNRFGSASGPSFVHVLESFLKMISKSHRLNVALALGGLAPFLVSRLQQCDASARLCLLKIIKVVYKHHPEPKQLIVELDLVGHLRRLVEGEKDQVMVLVKQMAQELIQALHINTVL